jgi:hypothetical protein
LYRFTFCRDCFDCVFHICPSPVYQAEDESEGQDADAKGDHDDDGVLATDLNAERNETRQIYFPSYNSKNIECSSKLCVRCRLFAGGIVIRSHYDTMVDNNRGRFFLAVEPAYADVEYVFFISSRWYHMLLLSCCLHNCRPHRLYCGGCARVCATSSS